MVQTIDQYELSLALSSIFICVKIRLCKLDKEKFIYSFSNEYIVFKFKNVNNY